MNNTTLPYWLALMVLIAASYGGWKWWQVEQFRASQARGGLVVEDGPPLEEFELTERSGEPFRSEDMRGIVWVTTFFFASCDGSCPRLNAHVKHMNSIEGLEEVTWVSITVDPENDTLAKLKEYADTFQADPEQWLFCRGDFNYVRRIGQDFMKVPIMRRDHNDFAIVIDKAGKIRDWHNMARTSELERLEKLLRECLKEEGPTPEEEPTLPQAEEATVETPQQESAAA